MANLNGMKFKYVVIKKSDIFNTDSVTRTQLECALDSINQDRQQKGKKENTYLVINTDEPYADEIIQIMKRHGHWG